MNYSIKKSLATFGLFLTLIVMGSIVHAQVQDEGTRIDTNLVLIDVLVMDRVGKPITGLSADQFELFTDNVRQPIESFSAEAAPVSFGIVYDMHPTTDDRTRAVIESLRSFKADIGLEDDIFLLAFDMRGQQCFDFVPTVEQLDRHMSQPDRREPTSLYDAVFFASNKIRSSRNQKRVLLIISDSADHQSRLAFNTLQRKLATIKVEVYAIIVDDNNDLGYKDITHKGEDTYPLSADASALDRAALLELTLKSGGSTYFGGSKSMRQLQRVYKEILSEMRSHYTLGFYPDIIDAKRHSLKVRLRGVPNSKDFVLAYRMNYQNEAKDADK